MTTPHPHTANEPCPGRCKDIDVVNEIIEKTKEELTTFEKRLQDNHDELLKFEARLDESSARMGRIEATLAANSSQLNLNTNETSEILLILRQGKALFSLADNLSKIIKWFLILATPAITLWLTIKNHK